MTVEFTFAELGLDTGPFELFSDLDGFTVPFETGVTRIQLLNGFSSANVPDYTTEVKVVSTGICVNSVNLPVTELTTTTTTTIASFAQIACGNTGFQYTGGAGWPTIIAINTGSATGEICMPTSTGRVPDRFILRENGVIIFDSGFQGGIEYDFGGGSRNQFKSWISSRIDPISNVQYPDFNTYPDDGFPRVNGIINDLNSFNKTTTTGILYLYVYGSGSGTHWAFAMGCPGSGTYCPTTTTTTTV